MANKITEKAIVEQVSDAASLLITQEETVDGVPVEALRRAALPMVKQHILAGAAPVIHRSASSPMVTITNAAERPAVQLVSTIEAVQEGTGDASTVNIRPIKGWNEVNVCETDKNLLVVEDYVDSLDAYTETCSAGVITRSIKKQHTTSYMARANSRLLSARLPAGTYIFTLTYISAGAEFTGPYAEVTLDSGKVVRLRHGTAATLEQSGTITGFRCESTAFASSISEIVYTLQIDPGDTATEYELGQGRKLTASLPETVYGGKRYWTTGEMLVTHAGRVLDGTENWVRYISGQMPYYYIDVGAGGSVVDGTGICSHFVTTLVASTTADLGYYIVNSQSGKARLLIRPDRTVYPDVDTWKAYLAEQYAAGTPVTCTYELSQPYTIQLDPQQLDLLAGLCNVWSDCGDTEIVYTADTARVIEGCAEDAAADIDKVYDRVYAHEVDVEWKLGGVISIVGAPAVAVATSRIYAQNLRVVCDSADIQYRCYFLYSDYDDDGFNDAMTNWMTGSHFISEHIPQEDRGRKISCVQLEFARIDGAVIGDVSEISTYVKIYALDTYASQGIDVAARLAAIEDEITQLKQENSELKAALAELAQ